MSASRLSAKKKEQALAQKEREFRELILKAYQRRAAGRRAFSTARTPGGWSSSARSTSPWALFVEEVITECRKRGASRVDVLAFEFEMGLFPAVLDEAKQKGIDLAPKTIPPEVFDKRAVEKGQVRFHDVSFIEVTPRFDKKDKLRCGHGIDGFLRLLLARSAWTPSPPISRTARAKSSANKATCGK